jgi:hypothetical protein
MTRRTASPPHAQLVPMRCKQPHHVQRLSPALARSAIVSLSTMAQNALQGPVRSHARRMHN